MRYARAAGWGAIAATPVLLSTLAVLAATPGAPASLVTRSLLAAWIGGALAFVAALLDARNARVGARAAGALAALVVVFWLAVMVFVSQLPAPESPTNTDDSTHTDP